MDQAVSVTGNMIFMFKYKLHYNSTRNREHYFGKTVFVLPHAEIQISCHVAYSEVQNKIKSKVDLLLKKLEHINILQLIEMFHC